MINKVRREGVKEDKKLEGMNFIKLIEERKGRGKKSPRNREGGKEGAE